MYNLTLQIYGGGVWKDAMTFSLRDNGLPDATFNHPAIVLGKLDQRLTTWGLQ